VVVGVDAADLGRGQEDVLGPLAFEEGTHRALVHEVQGLQANAACCLGAEIRRLAVDGADDMLEPLGQKGAHKGAADHAGRSGHEDLVCVVHLRFFFSTTHGRSH